MGKFDLQLLEFTLRDGGYVNDWKWGIPVCTRNY